MPPDALGKVREDRGTRLGRRLRLAVLGPLALTLDGRELRLAGRKARALLAYLALNNRFGESRDKLVGLLWSESDEERARASLRQVLREIRTACAAAGYDGFRTDNRFVALEARLIEVDLAAILEEAEAHRAHQALLHAPRPIETLLQEFDDLDPAFRAWLLAKQHNVQEALRDSLEAGMRREDLGPGARARLAEALLNLDATHEEACRLLMRVRAESGDVAGALRLYKTLWDLLDEDYGMEPSTPTQHLVADIKSGTFDAVPQAPAEPRITAQGGATRPGSKIVLAVGPIDMRGLGAGAPHLAEAFRQHLIACLVRFREWYLTDQPVAPDERPDVTACYELGLLAQQSDDTVTLLIVLKDTDSNVYVWSDAFNLDLASWLAMQRRIVTRIATTVKVHLSTERLTRLAGEPDVALGVYDRWLRCQAQILTFGQEDWEKAERQFRDIIVAAPQFTAAYCSLVQMLNAMHIVHPGVMRSAARTQQALVLARKAVQLDPTDTRAQLCLGWSHAMAGNFHSAALHMDMACDLNPHDPWTLIAAALFYAFNGRNEQAHALSGQATDMALRPSRTHFAYQVSIAYLAGDDEGALDAADRAADAIKTLSAWRAASLYRLGYRHEAREQAATFLSGVRAAWCGTVPPTDAAVVRWLLHLYPMSERRIWERLRDGLAGAGLPVDGIEYGA